VCVQGYDGSWLGECFELAYFGDGIAAILAGMSHQSEGVAGAPNDEEGVRGVPGAPSIKSMQVCYALVPALNDSARWLVWMTLVWMTLVWMTLVWMTLVWMTLVWMMLVWMTLSNNRTRCAW
jgi:hypothetical protein